MAEVSAEIAAKLGISTSEFKAALADAGASVKQFSAGGKKETDSFGEAVKGLHGGMREFKDLLMAGGIVEAVKGFFEVAIKAAEDSKDANDANAEAVRGFSEDLKAMHAGFGEMAMNTVGFFNRIGEGLGNAARYAKEFWSAQITGNKANLEAFDQAEESEKKAQEMERAFAEEKKKHGAEYAQINAEIKRTTEEIAAAQMKQLDPAEKVAKLEQERREIQDALASGTLDRLEYRKKELDLIKNQKDLEAAQEEDAKARRAQTIKDNKENLEVTLKGMSTQQQIAYLDENIRADETTIAALKKMGVDSSTIQAKLDDETTQKKKALAQLEADALKRREQIAGSAKEELEMLTLQHKVTLGIATGPEELRLKQIKLIRQERELENKLLDLAQKSIDGKLTPADRKRFEELIKQKEKLDQQVASVNDVIAATEKQKGAAAAVTDEYTQQVEKAAKLNNIMSGMITSITRYGQGYQDQTTAGLNSVLAKLKDELFASQQSYRKTIQQAGINPYDIDSASLAIQNEIGAVQNELGKRRDFEAYLKAFGSDAAEKQYGYDEFTKLMQFINPDVTKKQANDISSIAATLRNVFPDQAVTPR